MKTRVLDSPAKRVPIALAVLTLLILVGAGIYLFLGSPASLPANGPKVLAAAHAFTRALVQSHATVPQAIPVQTLIAQGFLQPADLGSLQGLDAKIFLTARGTNGPQPLMSVRLPDGENLILFVDGTSQKLKR